MILNIHRVKPANMALALLGLLVVGGTIFYLINVGVPQGNFLAALFTPVMETEEEKQQEEVEAIQEEVVDTPYYTETAQAGDGLTHLARRAFTRYLSDQGISVDSERRVFVEDYIQKSLGGAPLLLGEEVKISAELLSSAMELSLALEPEQVENLKSYSVLVSFN